MDQSTATQGATAAQAVEAIITDLPIMLDYFSELPKTGEPNKLYRIGETRKYYRWVGDMYVESMCKPHFQWLPIEQIFGPLAALAERIRAGKWFYFRNAGSDVKYVNIRVNLSTGDALLTDNRGNPITIEELQHQQPYTAGRPVGSKHKQK